MKTAIFCGLLLLAGSAGAQTYKCSIGGATVIQDRPCPGSVKRSDDMPSPSKSVASASVDSTSRADKLERDKQYINERIASRNYEREKSSASARIAVCDAEAHDIGDQISRTAANSPTGAPVNMASAAALQLDQQRRQTEIAALQSQQTAKLAQCAQYRREFADKFKN